MTKLIEIFFRHKWRLLLLLALPLVGGIGIIYSLPRQYQATANLLAMRRYASLGATGPESDLQSAPAVTQVTALTDLLQTRSFCLAVAADTDLPKLDGGSIGNPGVADAVFTDLSAHVAVIPTGNRLYSISYVNKNPVVAAQIVKAVIAHFATESASQATAEGQQLLKSYQSQLKDAQQAADNATQMVAQYLQQHNLTAASAQLDPQYQLINVQAEQARAAVVGIQNNMDQVNAQIAMLSTADGGLYDVVDPPTVPTRPQSITKTLLLGGGVGLLLGAMAAIGYFLILLRLDQSLYSPADVPTVTEYPVLIQIPRLPRRSAAWIAQANGRLLTQKDHYATSD